MEICKDRNCFIFEKRQIEASLVFNLAQLKINDNKLSTTNTNDTEDKC